MDQERLFAIKQTVARLANTKLRPEQRAELDDIKDFIDSLVSDVLVEEHKEDSKKPWEEFEPYLKLKSALDLFESVPKSMKSAKDMESRFETQTQDILHAFELTDPNEKKYIELGEQLTEIRKERRKVKDFQKLVAPLNSFLQRNPESMASLIETKKKMHRSLQALDKRTYITRECTALQEAFDKAKPKEEVVIQN